jgi:predicted oxidoreductase
VALVKTPQLTIPAVGFGTWELDHAYDNVRYALEAGYRHVDTAQIYRNEDDVGRAIDDSEVDRDDVFLTTKVWSRQARAEDVVRSTHDSLERLRTDHVDLLLLHWPADDIAPLEETLEAMLAQLEELGEPVPYGSFLDKLAEAASNRAEEGDGRAIWVRHVEPARVDARRATAKRRPTWRGTSVGS